MQLPLNVCQQFGQFAYQDEQRGIEAITTIQDFIEEYQNSSLSSNESLAKVVKIERNQAGIVTIAKSVKLLPNIQINLKALIEDTHECLKEATNFITIIGGATSDSDWLMKVGAVLYLIQFVISLITIRLRSQHARVLVALHHLCRSELRLEIPLSELQANYHFSLSIDELEEVLEDLVDLHCISRQQDVIYLTEKVILKDN
ncbi:MAG: hypothetical protein HC877_15065 [Thioploca sp.]|nr:hypothetical protein [Thioploca sp.]